MKFALHLICVSLLLSCNLTNSKNYRLEDTTFVLSGDEISAGDSFLEFFTRFMIDQEFQKSRTIFPFELPDKQILTSKEWQHIPFFSQNSYIPILTSDKLDPFEKDSNYPVLKFSILDFSSTIATTYLFEYRNFKWLLTDLEAASINSLPDADFIEFLIRFSKDSLFQLDLVLFPFPDLYADPNQDFEIVTTLIQKDQWEHLDFSAEIKELMLPDAVDVTSKYRYLSLNGNENGINIKYTFQKIDDQWKFVKSEEYST